jgi:hypothetical protein
MIAEQEEGNAEGNGEVLGEKPVSHSFLLPQVLYEMAWD